MKLLDTYNRIYIFSAGGEKLYNVLPSTGDIKKDQEKIDNGILKRFGKKLTDIIYDQHDEARVATKAEAKEFQSIMHPKHIEDYYDQLESWLVKSIGKETYEKYKQ